MKTVRWSEVFKKTGTPKIHLLLMEAKKDAEFQKALESQRIMTLHQPTESNRTDYGEVGYHAGKNGQFIIFPKSLRAFEGKRVVGIKYDLLAEEIIKAPKEKNVPAKRVILPKRASEKKEAPAKRPSSEAKEKIKKVVPKASENANISLNLLKEKVQQAITELENGNQVAAYKRLQQIVSE